MNKTNRRSADTDVHKAKIWEPGKKITVWQKASSDLLTYCSRMFWLSEGWMVSKMVRPTERRKVCLLLSISQGASFGSGVPLSLADESQQGILKKQGKHSPHHAGHCWPLSEAEPLGSSSRTLISMFIMSAREGSNAVYITLFRGDSYSKFIWSGGWYNWF